MSKLPHAAAPSSRRLFLARPTKVSARFFSSIAASASALKPPVWDTASDHKCKCKWAPDQHPVRLGAT